MPLEGREKNWSKYKGQKDDQKDGNNDLPRKVVWYILGLTSDNFRNEIHESGSHGNI